MMGQLRYILFLMLGVLLLHNEGKAQQEEINLAPGQVIYDFSFTPGGDSAILGVGNKLEIWSIEQQAKIRQTESRHTADIIALDYKMTEGRELVVSAAKDRQVILWDLESGKALNQLTFESTDLIDVIFIPGKTQAAIATSSKGVVFWNYSEKQETSVVGLEKGHVLSLSAHPVKPFIAAATSEGMVLIWNMDTWKTQKALRASTTWVRSVLFTINKDLLMATDDKGYLYTWKVGDEYTFINKAKIANSPLASLATDPKAYAFATGGHSKKMYVMVDDKRLKRKLKHYITQVKYRPGREPYLEFGVATYGNGFQLIRLIDFDYKQ